LRPILLFVCSSQFERGRGQHLTQASLDWQHAVSASVRDHQRRNVWLII
jgi:hypothetical protein